MQPYSLVKCSSVAQVRYRSCGAWYIGIALHRSRKTSRETSSPSPCVCKKIQLNYWQTFTRMSQFTNLSSILMNFWIYQTTKIRLVGADLGFDNLWYVVMREIKDKNPIPIVNDPLLPWHLSTASIRSILIVITGLSTLRCGGISTCPRLLKWPLGKVRNTKV